MSLLRTALKSGSVLLRFLKSLKTGLLLSS